jgi:transposase
MQNQEKQPYLSNRYTGTNWEAFRHFGNEKLCLKVPLKTEENIEAAVKYFNDTIQWAGWNSTPEHTDLLITSDYHILVKQKNSRKTKIQHTDLPITSDYPILVKQKNSSKTKQQKAKEYSSQQHKNLSNFPKTYKNNAIQTFLQGLTPTDSTIYSLRKVTKKIIRQKLPHLSGQLKEHGPEIPQKNYTHLLIA